MRSVPVSFAVIDGRPSLVGDCDIANAHAIEEWLAGFGDAAVELDASAVTFFDSTGLRALLNAARRNPNLRVVEPSRAVRRVLEITDTLELLTRDRVLR